MMVLSKLFSSSQWIGDSNPPPKMRIADYPAVMMQFRKIQLIEAEGALDKAILSLNNEQEKGGIKLKELKEKVTREQETVETRSEQFMTATEHLMDHRNNGNERITSFVTPKLLPEKLPPLTEGLPPA